LIAFVLLVAANEFATSHAALVAILVFIFSLAYLPASVVARRANLLYGTMLLGAFSYFLACYALGAPGTTFPVLAVPLVVALLIVGHHLKRRLPAGQEAFPRTVFRAMNITVAVYTVWALLQVGGLLAEPGPLRYVAGAAMLGYAGLYLFHVLGGAASLYAYVFSGFLVSGGALAVAAGVSADFCWLPAIASAAAILLVGTRCHQGRNHRWSRHFYVSSMGVIVVSLVLSLARWQFLVIDLALGSLVLWAAYQWLSRAVGSVRGAKMAERVMAKCFLYGAVLLASPVAVIIFIVPGDPYVAVAALICGVTFGWIAFQRRDQAGGSRHTAVLAAALFGSAGLLGLGRLLPGFGASAWALVAPPVLLAALVALRRTTGEKYLAIRTRLAEAAVFAAMFGWYVPLLAGVGTIPLIGAVIALAAVVGMGVGLKERSYLVAAGAGAAGVVVAAAMLIFGPGTAAWIACAAAAAAAGGVLVGADGRGLVVARRAANLAWVILAVAAIAVAAGTGVAGALYCVTAVGVLSALLAGARARGRRDTLDIFARVLAYGTALAAVGLGPFTEWNATIPGVCLLILAAGHWLKWTLARCTGAARTAVALFALGSVLVIFGVFSGVDVRLGLGAAVVAALMALATQSRRFPAMARSAATGGHLTSVVLACAALVQAWAGGPWTLPLTAVPLLAIYALTPRLRGRTGFRTGAVLWLSFIAIFGLASYGNTHYPEQMLLLAAVALVWLAAGYLLRTTPAKAWSLPLYLAAAAVAGFCGIVRMLAPVAAGSWPIFLAGGFVFACLFLILRQDVFAYLLTLALALMAYDWIKSTTSPFTQDVFFYLVIGGVMLAAVFLLPLVWKLLGRAGSIPVFDIFTRRGVALASVVIVAFALVLLSTYTLKVTGHPKFCLSCHNMGDYYSSWQHSVHADKKVACIDCHYEPGVTNTVKGKISGLVQVFKYVSHAYGDNPHAMISNASCMRGGCHSDMDHSKETLLFRGQIKFRHDIHLSEHPRGQELNCVSCHGQTVGGEHISVTKTTCLTCHFYDRGEEAVATGQCRTCHEVPTETVTFKGQDFRHTTTLAKKKGIECAHCHSRVTQGEGAVSSTRCLSCHRESKIEKIEDQEQFHLVHVSEGHFDCLQCHDEIKHGIHPLEPLAASGNCRACHSGQRHSLQERIYAGVAFAADDVKVQPSGKYTAGVSCDGCHTDVQSDTRGLGGAPFTKKVSSGQQCVACHGKDSVIDALDIWREDTTEALAKLKPKLEELTEKLKSPPPGAADLDKAKGLLESARIKITFVEDDGSLGAHNFDYVESALEKAARQIKDCEDLVAKWQEPAGEEVRE